MKSLMRLWASLLIVSYGTMLLLPAAALAATAPHPSCTLSVIPSVVSPGASATIHWTSVNATGGAITNVGNVGPSGSKQIIPPTNAQITIYVGSFTGPGGTANCTASVQISYGTNTGGTNSIGGSAGTGDPSASGNTSGDPGASAGGGLVTPNPIPAAGSAGTGSGGTQQALVQCGIGSDIGLSTSCQACNLAQLVQNIINFAIGVSIPIAAALFAWAGILYFTSGASPGNMERAKGIFSNALIGFLIAISAWLVVNTLLHALLDNGQSGLNQGNWFEVKCDVASRPIAFRISDIINQVLPSVNVSQPTPGYSPGTGVAGSGSGSAFGNACPDGSAPSVTDTGNYCIVNGQAVPAGSVVSNGNISAAAASYFGTNTSAGPDNGNLACAWAVNNVLQSAGVAPIDGDSVSLMEQTLQGGRGTQVLQSSAQAGDIVIFGGMSHVGICQDAGCTQVVSNSSSQATFTSVYPPTTGSRIYHINN